jgi:hypothetical protein
MLQFFIMHASEQSKVTRGCIFFFLGRGIFFVKSICNDVVISELLHTYTRIIDDQQRLKENSTSYLVLDLWVDDSSIQYV